ncbi:hypothetical protein HMPREF1633_03395 [Tissierellia bacterium S5-A11]|nr:hypothetical protein HMPREF1633_03395 [Tissierellia bacterium S5-A11]
MNARACSLITFDSFVLSGTYYFTFNFILLQKRCAANRASAKDENGKKFFRARERLSDACQNAYTNFALYNIL